MAPKQAGMSEELMNLRFMQRARFKQRHEVVAVCVDSRQTVENDKKSARFRTYAEEKRLLMQNFIDNFGLRWHDAQDAELQKDKVFGRMSFNGANRELENVMQLEMEDLGQQRPDKNAADWRKLGEADKDGTDAAAEYDIETPNDSSKKSEFYDPEEMIKINDNESDDVPVVNKFAAQRRQHRFEKPKALNQMRPDKNSARGARNYASKQHGGSTAPLFPPGARSSRWQKQNFNSMRNEDDQRSKNQSFRPQKKRTSHGTNKFPILAAKKFRAD